ncbi:MAG: hypothetical protein FJ398_06010 [Verrucomicrobia bacterium]|nr:hypothetical protein [Verrucomicrobiota bacterium]
MKTFHPTITLLTCFGACLSTATFAQVAPAPAPPQVSVQLVGPGELPPPPQAALEPLQLAQAATGGTEASLFLQDANQPASAWVAGDGRFSVDYLTGGESRPRTLVIRTTETDQKTLTALEEDLNVMSRILAKSMKEKAGGDGALTAMGMKIRTLAVGGSSAAQNLYLEGYGALFFLHTRFPLLPPPEPPKEETRKETASSTWEEARRELYGPKDPAPGQRWFFSKDSTRESYDADKVARLKESLLEALKNAANIRHLKSQEFVTLVVVGTETTTTPRVRALRMSPAGAEPKELDVLLQENAKAAGGGYGGGSFGFAAGGARPGAATIVRPLTGSAGETVMTIRAKKADADAFAKGDLKLDDFQKKVSITTY